MCIRVVDTTKGMVDIYVVVTDVYPGGRCNESYGEVFVRIVVTAVQPGDRCN